VGKAAKEQEIKTFRAVNDVLGIRLLFLNWFEGKNTCLWAVTGYAARN
jgi:hypothetical protein